MNWLKQNSQWIVLIITSIVSVLVGKFWDAIFKMKQHKAERRENYVAENIRLKAEINKLTDLGEKRAKYSYSTSGFYSLKINQNEQRICSRCLDSDGKEINLIVYKNNSFQCPNCKNAGWIEDEPEVRDELEAQIDSFVRYGN
jgi:hypothetical protein